MANIYATEPQTVGKVILSTTAGELSIELWPKEAPKAVRNFVQLCLEGYYDGCEFFRYMPDFLVQTGDPSNTGRGGESVYGEPFKDEFHSRLRFTRRGLVACANENRPHSNGSQFFLTLGKADGLDRKHTIFGSVTGESIYNLAAMNDLEAGKDERPIHAPVITGSEVLWNPFEDIVPRTTREERAADAAAARKEAEAAQKADQRQLGRKAGLLSFDEPGSDGEADAGLLSPPAKRARMQSAHDAAQDPRLAKGGGQADTEALRAAIAAEGALRQQAAAVSDAEALDAGEEEGNAGEGGATDFAARMRGAAQARVKAHGSQAGAAVGAAAGAAVGRQPPGPVVQNGEDYEAPEGADAEGDDEDEEASSEEDAFDARHRRVMAETRAKPAALRPSTQTLNREDLELLTEHQQRLAKAKLQTQLTRVSNAEAKARLAAFRARLRQGAAARAEPQATVAPALAAVEEAYAGRVRQDIDHEAQKPASWRIDNFLEGDDSGDEGLQGLLGQRLVFRKDQADAMARSENVDDYSVEDARDQPKGPAIAQTTRPGHPSQREATRADQDWRRGSENGHSHRPHDRRQDRPHDRGPGRPPTSDRQPGSRSEAYGRDQRRGSDRGDRDDRRHQGRR